MFETLESRQLLSASLSHGTLYVWGSQRGDTVHLRLESSTVIVFENSANTRFPASAVARIVVNGRGGDDFIINGAGSIPAVIAGGPGNDVLSGGLGPDYLLGGSGNDRLLAQAGNDLLDGGLGDDTMIGGDGADTALYSSRKNPVHVYLDGTPSGEAGEHDILQGIENIYGGAGDDALYGDENSNLLAGGAGNDTLDGLAGQDTLLGQTGNDLFLVRDGDNDVIAGGRGADTADLDESDTATSIESILDSVNPEAAAPRRHRPRA